MLMQQNGEEHHDAYLIVNMEARTTKQTLSCNHCMHRAPSLSSKKLTPNWLASNGIYSIIASRTLQCLSSASSTIAGNKD